MKNQVPISSIIVGERQRSLDMDHVNSLMLSLPEIGQIQPIIHDKEMKLLAGRHRLEAATLLGWTHIWAECSDAVDELTKQRIEYEEDIKRKERTWQERCLAVSKLFTLMRYEKINEGGNWTYREMETFTGISKTNIGNMIIIAEALNAKDESVWKAGGFVEAAKLILNRNVESATREMERRRQAMAVVAPLRSPQPDKALTQVISNGFPPVQHLDTTPLLPKLVDEKVEIVIHGQRRDFQPFIEPRFSLVIINNIELNETIFKDLYTSIKPNGYLVIWTRYPMEYWSSETIGQFERMPYPLIWNKLTTLTTTPWPFNKTYQFGYLFAKEMQMIKRVSKTAVISANEEEFGELPIAVTSFTLEALSLENESVLCLGVDPRHIAECGRVPFFFEPDKAKFDTMKANLIEWYKANVLGCVIKEEGV